MIPVLGYNPFWTIVAVIGYVILTGLGTWIAVEIRGLRKAVERIGGKN